MTAEKRCVRRNRLRPAVDPGLKTTYDPPVLGILLALACALTTNVGFLFKHRGACAAPPVDIRHPLRCGQGAVRSKLFAIGMLIASAAWIFHVAAMAVAPLSLVQAVLAGGVVLLAIMAERSFGLSISRRQWVGHHPDRRRPDPARLQPPGACTAPTRTSRCPG